MALRFNIPTVKVVKYTPRTGGPEMFVVRSGGKDIRTFTEEPVAVGYANYLREHNFRFYGGYSWPQRRLR